MKSDIREDVLESVMVRLKERMLFSTFAGMLHRFNDEAMLHHAAAAWIDYFIREVQESNAGTANEMNNTEMAALKEAWIKHIVEARRIDD